MSKEDAPRKRMLYGRQRGHRLRGRQQDLIANLLPGIQASPEKLLSIDPVDLFDHGPRDLYLEIGFGGGEHLAARARAEPQSGFIGAEPYLNGVAKLLSQIDDLGIANIRIHHGDARDLIEALPDDVVSGVYLLYPDPWPKKRHHKRRFVDEENLLQLHRIMKSGADCLFASDIEDYVRWTLLHFLRHPGFAWTAERAADWRDPPAGWPGTRYEAKALREGRTAHYLRFRKV